MERTWINDKILLSSTIVFLSLIVSILTAYGKYHITLAIGIGAALFLIVIINKHYILYYYLLFGALLAPGAFDRIAGVVSLTWVRNAILAVLFSVYVLSIMERYFEAFRTPIVRGWVLIVTVWTIYIGASSLWSLSPIDSMRYYPKFLLAACLGFALMLDDNIDRERALDLLLIGGVIFLAVSTLAEPFKSVIWPGSHSPYFMGLIGRHQSKFVFVFLCLLGLCNLMTKRKRTLSLLVIVWSAILLVLVVQRGAFLALGAGIMTIYLLSSNKITIGLLFRGVLFMGLVASIGLFLFYSPTFSRHMFFSGHDAEELITFLLQGDFEGIFDIIDFKGRWRMWGLVQSECDITFFGDGLGSTSVLIKHYYGRLNQLHSDWMQYLFEGGIVGFVLYCAMWILCLRVSLAFRKSSDVVTKTCALCLGGHAMALVFWSLPEHVLTYGHLTTAYLYMVAGLALKDQLQTRQLSPATLYGTQGGMGGSENRPWPCLRMRKTTLNTTMRPEVPCGR